MIKSQGFLRSHPSFFNTLLKALEAFLILLILFLSARFTGLTFNVNLILLGLTAVVCYYILADNYGLYTSRRGKSITQESLNIGKAWAFVTIILIIESHLIDLTGIYFQRLFIWWVVIVFATLIVWRVLIRMVLRVVRSMGFNIRHVVIVGAGILGLRLVSYLEGASGTGIKVVGFFDDHKEGNDISLPIPVLGKLNQLRNFLKDNSIDNVYIALPMKDEEKITRILHECRTLGAEIFVVPDILVYQLLNSRVEIFGDMLLMNFNPSIAWKRYFDLLFSCIAILITIPLWLCIAVAIKMTDGGPVFYGHRRITMAGKEFKCLKFRTMSVNADKKLEEILKNDPEAEKEWNKNFKLKNDPRLTKIGRFLRKTSLDELPQFINVLKGEMSVVGARPIVEKELNDYYKQNAGLYCSMQPGITGMWQVDKRSDTENYEERVALDTWYVQNHSLFLDIRIILKTIAVIIQGKGAY